MNPMPAFRLFARRLAAGFAVALPLFAGAQLISTVGGGGSGDGLLATQAAVNGPYRMAADGAGNLYIAEFYGSRIRRVDAATGIITTIVGNGSASTLGDGGPASAATVNGPQGVAVDGAGNVYLSDSLSRVIRKVAAGTGVITTIAGGGTSRGDGGPALQAALVWPTAVLLDAAGRLLVADRDDGRVRRIDLATNVITTVAGNGSTGNGGAGDGGPATAAAVSIEDIALDAGGNLLILDSARERVRRVDAATGIITTRVSGLTLPLALAIDGADNLFVVNRLGTISRIDGANGTVSTLFSQGSIGDTLGNVHSLLVKGSDLLVADTDNRRVRRIPLAGGPFTTIIGNGATYFFQEGTPAANGAMPTFTGQLGGVAVGGDGTIYAASSGYLSKILPGSGLLTLANPYGSIGGFIRIAAQPGTGHVYIADYSSRLVMKRDANTGAVSVVAGGGALTPGASAIPATQANLSGPWAVAIDAAGNLFIADQGFARVFKVDAGTGLLTTYAGNGSTNFFVDDVPATSTGTGYPTGLALDGAGNLFISVDNGPIRRVDAATGLIRSVVKKAPNFTGADGGPATSANLFSPQDVVADAAGNLYLIDVGTIRRVDAAAGTISTVAGGTFATIDDGAPSTRAFLRTPVALAMDTTGNLLVADGTRVRRLQLTGLSAYPGVAAFLSRLPQSTSLPRNIVLTNLGPLPAQVGSVSVGPPFAATSQCGTLAVGASCFITVTFTPAAVGSATQTLTISTDQGTATVVMKGGGELSLVAHFYENILRRSPDSSGGPYWESERVRMTALAANVNETWFSMSSSFFTSAEYVGFGRDANGYVNDLYRTFFNRAPDAPGLQFWVDQLANGMPREVVLAEFQLSGEFATFTQGYFGNTAARAEVDMVMDFYRGLLGRLPDSQGFNAWVQQFRAAQCQSSPLAAVTATAESISEAFATSNEYVFKGRSNGQYVGDLYNAFLRRGGDLAGVVNWINSLANATFTRKQLRDNFRSSTEFTTRLSQVAAQGCLP